MKTLTAFCIFLLFLCFAPSAAAQKGSENLIKNGDFEKFTGDNPDGWDTSNIPGTLTVVSGTKTCNSGLRAVKCEVKDFFGSVIAGYACQKNLPIGGKDVRLSGYFVVRAVGKDQVVIVLCYQNASGSTIGTAEEYLEDTKSKFIEFDKEFKAPAGAATVQVRLTILPNKESERAHPGSYFICDDLKLVCIPPKEKPVVQ